MALWRSLHVMFSPSEGLEVNLSYKYKSTHTHLLTRNNKQTAVLLFFFTFMFVLLRAFICFFHPSNNLHSLIIPPQVSALLSLDLPSIFPSSSDLQKRHSLLQILECLCSSITRWTCDQANFVRKQDMPQAGSFPSREALFLCVWQELDHRKLPVRLSWLVFAYLAESYVALTY